MFDIGFLELMLIGVVALLVVGPERLPKLARTLGLWLGRARRYASTVKADVERELREHEIQNAMGGKPEMKDIYEIVEDAQESVRGVAEDMDATQSELNEAIRDADRPSAGSKAADAKAPAQAPEEKGGTDTAAGSGAAPAGQQRDEDRERPRRGDE